jgi:hypothetical protein
MKNHLKIFGLTIILLISFSGAFGQTNEFFVSGEGGFGINLPNFTSSKEVQFEEQGMTVSGAEYLWEKENEFFYQVQYLEFWTDKKSLTPAQKKSALDFLKNGLAGAAQRTGTPYEEKPFSINGYTGGEIEIKYPFSKMIYRYVLVNKIFYVIGAIIFRLPDEARIRQVLDSFRLLNKQEILAAKVREATPEALPQAPIAPKPKSDAEDEGLKGRVKIVTEERLEWKYRNFPKRRQIQSETLYNERGNKIKKTGFGNGVPFDIDVYGYLDNMRVSRNGFVYTKESGVVQAVKIGEPKTPPQTADERYDSRYEYKYENGFLKEEAVYQNDGDLSRRIVHNRSGNKIETSYYDDAGKVYLTYTYQLDAKGNVTEEQGYDVNAKKIQYRYAYKYETFDAQGNWTKRTASEWKTRAFVPTSLEYRMITYYP